MSVKIINFFKNTNLKKQQQIAKTLLVLVYAIFTMVIFILPLFSFDNYSIVSNTTSHLGAQGSPNAWVMNVVFIVMGLTTILIVFNNPSPVIILFGVLFGGSLVLTGIFRHAALIENFESNILLDQFHSVFATTTGIGFVALSSTQGFISKDKQRTIAFLMAVFATLLSVAMMIKPQYMGILQRLMFLISFAWIFFYLKNPNFPPK